MELAGGHLRPDGQGFGEADRSCIQALVHPHDGRRRLGIPRDDGALDRCCAAPARQGGRVQVQAALAWRNENRLRQDEAIGDDDGHIGGMREEGVLLD